MGARSKRPTRAAGKLKPFRPAPAEAPVVEVVDSREGGKNQTTADKKHQGPYRTMASNAPVYRLPGGKSYTPSPTSVLVIAAGAPWVWETEFNGQREPRALWSADYLASVGFDVTLVGDSKFDCYPEGWKQGRPDLASNEGKNHTTAADELVLPKLEELVAEGRGPSVIIAGSRGGQCTLPRLWSLGWCGAAVCVNAGCTSLGRVPSGCSLGLVTGGFDFFRQSAEPQRLVKIRRECNSSPILVYHSKAMGHTGSPTDYQEHGHHLLDGATLKEIIQLVASGPKTSSWPTLALEPSHDTNSTTNFWII